MELENAQFKASSLHELSDVLVVARNAKKPILSYLTVLSAKVPIMRPIEDRGFGQRMPEFTHKYEEHDANAPSRNAIAYGRAIFDHTRLAQPNQRALSPHGVG